MKRPFLARTLLGKLTFAAVCLATLIGLFYAVENWRGRRAFAQAKQRAAAKGDRLDWQAFVPPEVPGDQNLALTSVFAGMFDYERGPRGVVWRNTNTSPFLASMSTILSARDPGKSRRSEALDKNELMDLKAYQQFFLANTNLPHAEKSQTPADDILVSLSGLEPGLKELKQAAASHPLTRFPVHFEENFGCLLPHLARIKSIVQYLKIHASASLELGRTEQAFEDIQLAYRLTDGIKDEPYLISHMVRIACAATSTQIVKEGLVRHRWNDAQLKWIENRCEQTDLVRAGHHALKGERALGIEGLDQMRRGQLPLSTLSGDESNEALPDFIPHSPLGKLLPSGWFYQNMASVSRFHDEYLLPGTDPAARRIDPREVDDADPAIKRMKTTPYNLVAKMLVPALSKTPARTARWQTALDHAEIACALERYRLANNAYPQRLEQLVPEFATKLPTDVITGQNYRYVPAPGDQYLLYSVGWNRRDDGGQVARAASGTGVESQNGDWVWSLMPTEPVRIEK